MTAYAVAYSIFLSNTNHDNITSLQGMSKSAFNKQTVACVFYELEGAAPKLGELGTFLKYCIAFKQPQDFECAVTFHRHLNSLHGALTRLVTHYIHQDDAQDPTPGPSQWTPSMSHPQPSTPPPYLPTHAPNPTQHGRKRTI